jgi:DNA-binding MarR family transcriptional regulator
MDQQNFLTANVAMRRPPPALSNEALVDQLLDRESSETLAAVRFVIAARRTREAMIGTHLFADAAWDILLELYAAALTQTKVATTDLCIASAVPATTALRWADRLEGDELLQRQGDPLDGRRTWVKLTSKGELKMQSYFRILRSGMHLG